MTIEDVVIRLFNVDHTIGGEISSVWYATYKEPMAYRDCDRYLSGEHASWNEWFESIIKAIEGDHANAFLSKSGWIRGLAKCIKGRSDGV